MQNFIYSEVWPHYTDAIAAMKKCGVVATEQDSFFNLFELMEHERLGLNKMPFLRKGEIKW
jgi:hypothetical protein